MSVNRGPKIVRDGLVLCLDAADKNSYSGAGTIWKDLSSLNNNGTLTNGPTYSSINNGSVVFDGIDDYVPFVSNPSLTNQITVEAWINLSASSPNANGCVFGREGSYRLIYNTTSFTWVCATVNNAWYTAGTNIQPSFSTTNGICNVVGTYDGSKNSVYINGALATTGSAISGNILTAGTYYLFRNDSANISYGKGNLYSHRIYNRGLSSSEVLQNYNATKGRFNLVWDMGPQ